MPTLIYTDHASCRMHQRAVSERHVMLVIRHGKKIHKQGMVFHVMRDRDFPRKLRPHLRGRVKGIVVVTVADQSDLIVCTVYRSDKALKQIKRKSKTLL